MPSLFFPRMYDETAAKAAYVQQLQDIAVTQDLSEDLQPQTRNLTIGFTVIGVVVVGLRFLGRYKQCIRLGSDDWLILVSLLLLAGNFAINLVLIHQGLGLHSGALTLEELQTLNQTILGAEILYVTAVNMYKISLLFLYFRIFPVRSICRGGYICGGISTAWNLACIMAATFQCSPRERLWEPWLQGTCINLFLTQLCISVPSILCDIAILCLPIPHVWRLQTNLTQKVCLTGIFLLGSYVVFTSIYRFRIFLLYRTEDVPFTLANGCAWNVIEISSGIVSASLPTLGPLLRYVSTSIYPSLKFGSKYGLSPSSHKRSNVKTVGGGGGGAQDKALRREQRDFSREDSKYGIMDDDTELDAYGGRVTVTMSHNRPVSDANSSGDEIPLTAIRQQREIELTEESIVTRENNQTS